MIKSDRRVWVQNSHRSLLKSRCRGGIDISKVGHISRDVPGKVIARNKRSCQNRIRCIDTSVDDSYDNPSSGEVVRSGVIRMVYQSDGLFPWKTAGQNILLGLRHVRIESDRESQLKELLELIGMEGFGDHYPHQLSGGMRQRVELARALAGESDILLMDEPFSALDYLTRLRMRRELARMLTERPRTVILVTHDIEEAAQLADRVIVLSERPARIQCELRLDVPRPRDLTHPDVISAVHQILAQLGLESNTVGDAPNPIPNYS